MVARTFASDVVSRIVFDVARQHLLSDSVFVQTGERPGRRQLETDIPISSKRDSELRKHRRTRLR